MTELALGALEGGTVVVPGAAIRAAGRQGAIAGGWDPSSLATATTPAGPFDAGSSPSAMGGAVIGH